MATLGGPALPVSVQTGVRQAGGAAIPVAVVSDGRATQGGPAQAVYVVTSGPVQGGPALPVVAAAAGARVAAGPAVPVYVVSGSLSGGTQTYTQKVQALGPIAYWPLADAAGPAATDESGNGLNGTYTNVTLGVAGIGDGRTAALFVPASSSRVSVNSVGLSTAFNGAEGTLSLWAKVSAAGVWADGVNRWLFRIERGAANNLVDIIKRSIAGQVDANYRAGGVTETVSPGGLNSTGWLHFAITWSAGADQMKVFLNGAQTGATQVGLGVWAVGAFDAAVIGAVSAAGASPYDGSIAHVALWASALTPAQIATLATV